MTTPNLDEAAEFAAHAREFLVKSREHLAADDLHQASEKGWGAAARMAKAVAATRGWEYATHSHFHVVMNRARRLTGDDRLPLLHGRAEILHGNYYERKRHLDAEQIGRDIENIAELVDLLAPLAGPGR